MRVLLDTNILLRLGESTSAASIGVRELLKLGSSFVLVPQALTEYWAVATRPASVNGLGLTPEEALADIADFKQRFELLYDNLASYAAWESLVVRYAVIGKQAHDAKLVGAMISHGVPAILTLNAVDFRRFSEIQVLTA